MRNQVFLAFKSGIVLQFELLFKCRPNLIVHIFANIKCSKMLAQFFCSFIYQGQIKVAQLNCSSPFYHHYQSCFLSFSKYTSPYLLFFAAGPSDQLWCASPLTLMCDNSTVVVVLVVCWQGQQTSQCKKMLPSHKWYKKVLKICEHRIKKACAKSQRLITA